MPLGAPHRLIATRSQFPHSHLAANKECRVAETWVPVPVVSLASIPVLSLCGLGILPSRDAFYRPSLFPPIRSVSMQAGLATSPVTAQRARLRPANEERNSPALSAGRLIPGPSCARSSKSGATTVEFALALLPLFALLFMTIDLSWIILGWAAIQEGAREGARYAVTGSGQSEASLDSATKSVVVRYSFGFANASNISVDYYSAAGYSSAGMPPTLDGQAGATGVGNVVKVSVQGVTIGTFGPIFRTFSPIVLSASASDVLQ